MPDDTEDHAKPVGTPPTNVPSETTPEEDRMTASQRQINRIWEITQALIAGVVICTGMAVAATLAIRSDPSSTAAFVFLTGAVNLVVGFYFGRTNHQRTGGIGGSSVTSDR